VGAMSRFASFSDSELLALWNGLTMDDGIRYGVEEDWKAPTTPWFASFMMRLGRVGWPRRIRIGGRTWSELPFGASIGGSW
jgi:hypothetical protein